MQNTPVSTWHVRKPQELSTFSWTFAAQTLLTPNAFPPKQSKPTVQQIHRRMHGTCRKQPDRPQTEGQAPWLSMAAHLRSGGGVCGPALRGGVDGGGRLLGHLHLHCLHQLQHRLRLFDLAPQGRCHKHLVGGGSGVQRCLRHRSWLPLRLPSICAAFAFTTLPSPVRDLQQERLICLHSARQHLNWKLPLAKPCSGGA